MPINPFCLVIYSCQNNRQMVCLVEDCSGMGKILIGEWLLLTWSQALPFFSQYLRTLLCNFSPTLIRWAIYICPLSSTFSILTFLFLALKTLPKLLLGECLEVLFYKKSTAWFNLLMKLQLENSKVNKSRQEELTVWQKQSCYSSVIQTDISLEVSCGV